MTLPSGSNHVIIVALLVVTVLAAAVRAENFYEKRNHADQYQYEKHPAATLVHTEYQAENWLRKYGYLGNCRNRRNRRKRRGAIDEESLMGDIMEEGSDHVATGSLRGNLIHECSRAQVTKAILKYQKMYSLPRTGLLDTPTKEHMNSRRCGNKDTGDDYVRPTPTPTARVPARRRRRSVQYIHEGKAPSSHELNGQPGSESTGSRRAHRARTMSQILRTKKRRRKRSTVMNANQTSSVMFSKKVVTYRILESGYSTKIDAKRQWELLDLAFRMWSEVIPIQFLAKPKGNVLKVDVEVAFGRGSHQNCYHDFDGVGGEIAHAWYYGDMHLDDDENFKCCDAEGINFLNVAVHEIGHVLGLNHSDRVNSIMYGIYDMLMGKDFELQWQDRKEIQTLYGVCKGKFDIVMDWVRKESGKRVFNTYFFRGHKYWMYENKENRTRYGDPQIVVSQWENVPSNVDGYAHLLYWNKHKQEIEDTQYFFKGCSVYKFDAQRNNVVDGWPREMSEVFPGVPCMVDSVFFDTRDTNLYFFKGNRVYVHNPQSSRCCVRNTTIAAEFPEDPTSTKPLQNDLDAVYYSYADDAQYFFKGEHVWENIRFTRRRGVQHNSVKYIGVVSDKWYDICDVDI